MNAAPIHYIDIGRLYQEDQPSVTPFMRAMATSSLILTYIIKLDIQVKVLSMRSFQVPSAMIEKGFIDENRIGLQGHSWGGYQIADILTKTDMFKCAESGAPVVNMISAYGGIRWGSGMSRMFQYEHTQSRLGSNPMGKSRIYT